MKIFAVLCIIGFTLSGCVLLGGKDYVVSYGVEATTDESFGANEFVFSTTISGR